MANKRRTCLTKNELECLNKYKDRSEVLDKPQYRRWLSNDEYQFLQHIRENGTAIINECEEQGIPLKDVKHYWHKSKKFSIFAKNSVPSYFDVRDDIVQSMRKHAPSYKYYDRELFDKPCLLVIDPADVHIGKLGKDHNNISIVERVHEGVDGIISKAKGFNIDQILFVAGNDILHVDNTKRTTTGGTHQDTDGMWHDNYLIAKQLYIDILEKLLNIADVHFVFNPSNHDYTNGYFLADTIESWFKNNENITFDCTIDHRKYFVYGNNLIGTTHGDGAKNNDLPLLMAHEKPELWSQCTKRYIYTHHVHHKNSKDHIGVTIESLRSPSGTDAWHDKNGYISKKAIEGFIHDEHEGQIARITQYV